MGMMPDWKIAEYVEKYGMISPFADKLTQKGVLSYGLSSYGYDARLASDFRVFKEPHELSRVNYYEIDPKNFNEDLVRHVRDVDSILVPANGFILGTTVECFKLPQNVMSICMGKSTYARCGLNIIVTPIEPGSNGQVTLELSNSTPFDIRVYANEGICQFLFFDNSGCHEDYESRGGKYQGQQGVVLPRIKR